LAEGKEVGLFDLLLYDEIRLGKELTKVKKLLWAQRLRKTKR